MEDVTVRLGRIESMLSTLMEALSSQRSRKDHYTTAEVAKALGRDPYTVRQWCNEGRVNAGKRACGRGKSKEWIISFDELERIRNEGLLPHR